MSAVVPAAITPCTGPLSPLCQAAGGVGSGLLGSGVGGVLGALSSWVADGAAWLIGQIGGVLSSSTTIDLGAGWFSAHYRTMVGLAAVVLLPLLLLSVIQAVYRQSVAGLVRVVAVQLPLALVLAGAAVELVQLALSATDALSTTISSGSGTDVQQALSQVASALASQAASGPAPAFVVLLGALLVAFGAFMLWVELLVREAAVYVAVLFLPLGLASLVWPAISHWCRRLVDTLVALILSKFVIVAILALAAGAIASGGGTGFAPVLAGGALLLLAAFTPFTLLRLVPAVEAGAVHQLEGSRQRVQQAAVPAPRSAASYALRRARESSFVTGEPGTGRGSDYEAPGTEHGAEGGGGRGASGSSVGSGGEGAGSPGPTGGPSTPSGGGGSGIKMWRGTPPPASTRPGSPPAGQQEPFSLPDPTGRGPVPLWGGPIPELDGDAASATGKGTREPRSFRHDDMGPVLLGDPAHNGGDVGEGGGADGEGGGGGG
ncbi:MAG: hypothetical protein ACLP62_09510 [Acidimicrobiales bacterium]